MAKKAALTKLQNMESRRLAAAARARAVAKQTWDTQQHTMVAAGSAFGLGYAASRGISMPTIDGIDPAVLYAGVAFAASMFVKDKTFKRVAEGVTDGLLGVAMYKAGANGFQSLFSYEKPAPVTSVPQPTAESAGWGDEIIETGAF